LLEKAQLMQLEACLPDFWWVFAIVATAYIYNHTSIRHLKWKISHEIFLGNKPKTLHFYIFGCGAYVFLPSEVCANKLALCSELMIFIGYKDNGYHFMYHTQGNITFCSIHAIFDKELFPKCTDSHAKEYKLYNRLLNKISPETESLVPNPSGKDRPVPVPIPHIPIPPIQNNPSTCSSLPSLSYKSPPLLPTPGSKKPTVEIEEDDDVDSNVEIQPLSPQQPLQFAL